MARSETPHGLRRRRGKRGDPPELVPADAGGGVGGGGTEDSEFAVKSHSIISNIAYIALTMGRQLPSYSEQTETSFL